MEHETPYLRSIMLLLKHIQTAALCSRWDPRERRGGARYWLLTDQSRVVSNFQDAAIAVLRPAKTRLMQVGEQGPAAESLVD
jgi:hypothetical protein